MSYQVTGPQGIRHRVDADMPSGDTAARMWRGQDMPELACKAKMSKVVNFYQGDESPGRHACSRCFPLPTRKAELIA